MIKRTFYNLPPEKREKIIDVTRKEFYKGNKKKITINSVIKNAGISRGSFYQYFDDKLDLVELMTNDLIDNMLEYIKDELVLCGGDIFEIPMKIFDITAEKGKVYKDIVVMSDRNNLNNDLIAEYMQYRFHKNNVYGKLLPYVNRSKLKLKDDEELKYVVFMLVDFLRSAARKLAKNPKNRDTERIVLSKKIEILKRAVCV